MVNIRSEKKIMINIGICDDEQTICSELENMLVDFQKNTLLRLNIETYCNGQELIDDIRKGFAFDLLFLDIEIGAVNGLDIGRTIRGEMEDHITKIVYITSKNGYETQLFDVQPIQFLPKPLEKSKVHITVSLALRILNKENNIFIFKTVREAYRIPIKEIIYFESTGRIVKLVSTKSTFEFYGKIDVIARNFSEFRFIRPHQSYLINYDHALRIGTRDIIMSNGDIVDISRRKSKEVEKLLVTFYKEEEALVIDI